MTSVKDIADYSVIASDVYNENQDDETGKSQAYDKIKSKEYKTDTLTLERKIYQKFDNDIDVSVYFRESKSQSGEVLPEIVVSFGGTNGATDFLSDLRRGFNPYNPEMEKIRSSVRNEILEIEKKHKIKDIKVTSVGHSLGGCYAELFAASFYGDEKEDSGKRVNVMTFNGFGAALGLRDYNNFAKNDKWFNGEQYKPERIGLSEHYSNEKDGVSMITGHLGNSSSYIIPTDVSGIHGLDNHSIENLIDDLIKVTNGSKEIILSEKNNITPGDYSSFFNDKDGVIEQFERYKQHIIGTREDNIFVGGDLDDFIDGYIGNDTIVGNGGNDFLFGGIGKDILADSAIKEDVSIYENGIKKKAEKYTPLVSSRTDSGNVYVGGKDDDSIYDTAGNDTIFYNKGDGHDLMVLSETLRDSDNVIFGEDIKPGDLSFTVSGDKMVMHIAKGKDKEGSLTFDNWFTSKNTSAQKVELFVFKDGTELTWQQISEMATMKVKFGTDNADTINGDRVLKNAIYGLNGDDTLTGGEKNDTINGGDGNDKINGSYGNDILIGGKGNDIINDAYGKDEIYYSPGDGHDEISVNNSGTHNPYGSADDKIVFTDGINLSDVSFHAYNKDLKILIGNNNPEKGSITVKNWFSYPGDWYDKLEKITFSDGKELSWKEVNNIVISTSNIGTDGDDEIKGMHWMDNVIYGGAGNDIITGLGFKNEIHGGSGNDFIIGSDAGRNVIYGDDGNDIIHGGYNGADIIGGRGNDTIFVGAVGANIYYGIGDGDDVITPYGGNGTLIFGKGIHLSDLSYDAEYGNNNALTLNISGSGKIKMNNWFKSPWTSDGKIANYKFESDGKEIHFMNLINELNIVKWEKEKAQSSKLTKQYDLLSQEMAASDADAEPTIDYNKQNQDLYAYIEH